MKNELIYDFVQQLIRISPIMNQSSTITKKTISDLNVSVFGLAYILVVKDNAGISQIEISEKLQTTRQQTTRIKKGLLEQGLIEEKTDPKNKSKKNIYLTNKCNELMDKFKAKLYKNYVETLGIMSDDDIKKATLLVANLSDILEKYFTKHELDYSSSSE